MTALEAPALLLAQMISPSPAVLTGALGAFTVGLTGSVHCLMMCGPLACAALPSVPGPQRRKAVLAYQGGRITAYAALGGALGALGSGVARTLDVSVHPALPWLMAAALVASALELGKRLRPLPGLSHLVGALSRVSAKFSFTGRAGAMGALTPLLPCGLLYGVFAAALASGSFTGGALLLGAFALGGLPALLGAQLQTGLWRHRPVLATFLLQRALPLAAATVLVFRALGTPDKPSCH
ncbi:sulfite exporter TauE/SafE family protein [Hyalangium versicolor]|uniref:sulfite exporter TauE/SafE family protein n=1 Tax=Hyalangium versicolor TaxID=2861190 RepID=UPI001CCCE9C8|nr:sulfite exporter TauE/SafE family protein [Hyalangium versicolor]